MQVTNLLIIEGKGKIKTIKKLLDPSYEVLATGGHIMQLSNQGFQNAGVNADGTLDKVLSPQGKKTISYIKQVIRKHHLEHIYIATDLDREGEAIADDVYQQLDPKSQKLVQRIGYTEITKSAISNAIKQPIGFNQGLINAQHCRQGFDKLLGFTMSKAVQLHHQGLSAGRVQSVALKIVKDREDAHHNYQPTIRYRLDVEIIDEQNQLAPAIQYDNFDPKVRQKIVYQTRPEVIQIQGPKVQCVAINELPLQFQSPPKPYITSSLLTQAANQLNLNTKHVTRCLQTLYEQGLITYPRTDSMTISDHFITAAKAYISANYGNQYCRVAPVIRQNKASAQAGHECIRVTDLNVSDLQTYEQIDETSNRIYKMIWINSLVQLMSDAKIQVYENCFESENGIKLIVKNRHLAFPGWKIIQKEALENNFLFKINHFYDYQEQITEFDATSRPQLFSEATLIAYLEQKEIGRPSTYATYPSTIQERDYVYLNEQKKLVTTKQGQENLTLLDQIFKEYVQEDYTANWEKTLDAIANHQGNYQRILQNAITTMSTLSDQFNHLQTQQSRFSPFDRMQKSNKFCKQCQAHRLIKITKTGAKMLICKNWKYDPETKQATGCQVEWLK